MVAHLGWWGKVRNGEQFRGGARAAVPARPCPCSKSIPGFDAEASSKRGAMCRQGAGPWVGVDTGWIVSKDQSTAAAHHVQVRGHVLHVKQVVHVAEEAHVPSLRGLHVVLAEAGGKE